MRKSRHELIRSILLKHEDGLTKTQICQYANLDQRSIKKSLDAMPDVYIDRWEQPKTRVLTPIYIAVPVPEDCPKP
jgi:predicted transcriptional regulator